MFRHDVQLGPGAFGLLLIGPMFSNCKLPVSIRKSMEIVDELITLICPDKL